MSHKHNRFTQTWLTHNDYLTTDIFHQIYFNKLLKSNQKPTEMNIEYLSDWMNEKLTLKGDNDKI